MESRKQLYQAAIACGHSIDENKVVLHRDRTKSGNALSQLADRLDGAFKVITPAPLAQAAAMTGKLTKSEAGKILDLALDLEKTGRIVSLSEGQEKTDFMMRNRAVQCALTDALDILTAPDDAPAPAEYAPAQLLELDPTRAAGSEVAVQAAQQAPDFIEFTPRPGPTSGWCSKCGCGNDVAGYAHLPACLAKSPAAQQVAAPSDFGIGASQFATQADYQAALAAARASATTSTLLLAAQQVISCIVGDKLRDCDMSRAALANLRKAAGDVERAA